MLGVGSGGGQNKDLDVPEEYTAMINQTRREHYAANRDRMRAIARSRYRDKALAKHAVCEICGYNHQDALVVHHKDMDRSNANADNLAVLCANCHMRIHKLIKTLQKTQQITAVAVFDMFRRAELKHRNEAGTPDRATRTEGSEQSESGATHSGTSHADMNHHEAGASR